MNFLVTGSSGFTGRHLCKYLKSLGHRIVEFNSKCGNLIDNPIWELTSCFDLHNYRDPDPFPEEIDYIIHLAAVAKAGDWHRYNKGDVFIQNQLINTNILNFWKLYCPQAKFIGIGSSCMYDARLDYKYEDDCLFGDPDKDLEAYAYSKRMLLVGMKSIAEQYNLKYIYLIPNTLYGPNFELTDSHFIFDLIKKIYNGKTKDEEVVLWGTGEQKRELVYIDDLVKLLYGLRDRPNEIINIGTGKEYSIKTYAKMICNILDYNFNDIKFDTNAFQGVSSKCLDITKIKELVPEYDSKLTSLEYGLRKTIDYYINKIN